MRQRWAVLVSCFLVLVLLIPAFLGCGGGKAKGQKIVIGQLTDFTGPASAALVVVNRALEDTVRYWNEHGLIPGVTIKTATYDTQWNPSRDIPGYDWVRQKGAEVVITYSGSTVEALKYYTARDKVPLVALGSTISNLENPGWMLALVCPSGYVIKTLLQWISEKHWDYSRGIPKIGGAGYDEPDTRDIIQAMKQYCQDHPGEFEWVGGFLVPFGSLTWSGEVEALKDCDYLYAPGSVGGTVAFLQRFRALGYEATVIGADCPSGFRGLMLDAFGYEATDGWLSALSCRWWTESFPVVDLAKQLLGQYRSEQAADIMYAGNSYVGVVGNYYSFLEIAKQAVEKVGAEQFDGQAFYDAALAYKTEGSFWQGYAQWGFTETRKYMVPYVHVYEWDAESKDMVCISDWLPVVE